MTQVNSNFSNLDLDAQRRKALVKVYSLLIKLAEEFEELSITEEIVQEPATTNPVPLKSNIPIGQ